MDFRFHNVLTRSPNLFQSQVKETNIMRQEMEHSPTVTEKAIPTSRSRVY